MCEFWSRRVTSGDTDERSLETYPTDTRTVRFRGSLLYQLKFAYTNYCWARFAPNFTAPSSAPTKVLVVT